MISFDLAHCSIPLLRALAEESKKAENIDEILRFNEEAVYKTVSENMNASQETLRYLYDKYGIKVMWSLAANISTPQDILGKIAKECSEGVAGILLKNSALATGDIDVIVERFQEEESILARAIRHDNISASTLIKIADLYSKFAEDIFLTGKVKFVES